MESFPPSVEAAVTVGQPVDRVRHVEGGHTLRHTYASMLIEAGEPLTYIQQQLGHHSPAFTLKVYGHLLPRAGRRGVDVLDDSATTRNPAATDLFALQP